MRHSRPGDGRDGGALRMLVIDADDFAVQLVRGMVEGMEQVELVGWAAEPAAGLRLVARTRPDLVLLELPDEAGPALEAAARLSAALPAVQIVASSAHLRPELLRRAMRAGVRDLVARPLEASELAEVLDHARGLQIERRQGELQVAETIAFFGAGGGLGTTTLAVNVAVTCAHQPGARVLLADLDLGGGDVPLFLDLDGEATTFTDVMAQEPGAGSLPGLLATHRSGLLVMPGPQRIEDLEAVRPEELAAVLNLCRSSFRLVVADAGHAVTDGAMSVLDRADRIYLVTQMTLPSLHGAARRLDLFQRLGYPEERCAVVVNRGHRRAHMTRVEAEEVLGVPIGFEIESDYAAALAAIDAGVPLVEVRRGKRVRQAIRRLARRHLDGPAEPPAGDATRPEAGRMTRAGAGDAPAAGKAAASTAAAAPGGDHR